MSKGGRKVKEDGMFILCGTALFLLNPKYVGLQNGKQSSSERAA